MTLEAHHIEEQLRQVERDLVELDEQVAAGEIDPVTADRLRGNYRTERDRLRGDLAGAEDSPRPRLMTGRRLVGAAVLLLAAVGLALWVTRAVGGSSGGLEGVASDVAQQGGVDLSSVTDEEMEAVVAANPNIVPMRLALADRYFNEGDFTNALRHYMVVLDDLGVEDPGALANVGWMTYLSNQPEVALSFVQRSLAIQPDGGVAFWYLANIEYYGLGDAAAAVDPLRELLAYDSLPDELRTAATALLTEVEAAP
jgi:tetratricopeptide (TPR) repeat protein